MIEVVFDIETMNLFGDNGATEPAQLGVSIVSAYRRETDSLGNEKKGEMKSSGLRDYGVGLRKRTGSLVLTLLVLMYRLWRHY